MNDRPPFLPPPPGGAATPSRADRPGRVVDLRAWHEAPGMRRLRPPRALWGRMPTRELPLPVSPVVPVASPLPRVSSPAPRVPTPSVAPLHGPLLVVACAESRVVEQLRQHLPVASVLQNIGGVMPRTARSPRVQGDVATIEEALEQQGVRHVVCVGHLGCRVADGSGRFGRPAPAESDGDLRSRQLRAVEHHVFTQLQRVRAYLRQRPSAPTVRLTGLWVDERTGHVHAFDPARRRFAPLEAFDLVRYSAMLPARSGSDAGDA